MVYPPITSVLVKKIINTWDYHDTGINTPGHSYSNGMHNQGRILFKAWIITAPGIKYTCNRKANDHHLLEKQEVDMHYCREKITPVSISKQRVTITFNFKSINSPIARCWITLLSSQTLFDRPISVLKLS